MIFRASPEGFVLKTDVTSMPLFATDEDEELVYVLWPQRCHVYARTHSMNPCGKPGEYDLRDVKVALKTMHSVVSNMPDASTVRRVCILKGPQPEQ